MKSHCNTCGGEKNHVVLHERKTSGVDEPDEHYRIHWGATYRLLQCAGCESISMREDSWDSTAEDEQGRPIISTKNFPPRIFRSRPKWMFEISYIMACPGHIRALVEEVYITLQNDCRSSAAMCVRAIFEAMMIDKAGDNGSFSSNLDAFERAGLISAQQKKIVEPVLEAGHASIHRGYRPTKEQIITLVDVLENLVDVIYVQPSKSDALKKAIPERKKKGA